MNYAKIENRPYHLFYGYGHGIAIGGCVFLFETKTVIPDILTGIIEKSDSISVHKKDIKLLEIMACDLQQVLKLIANR